MISAAKIYLVNLPDEDGFDWCVTPGDDWDIVGEYYHASEIKSLQSQLEEAKRINLQLETLLSTDWMEIVKDGDDSDILQFHFNDGNLGVDHLCGEFFGSDFLFDLEDGCHHITVKYNPPTFRNGGLIAGGHFDFGIMPEGLRSKASQGEGV